MINCSLKWPSLSWRFFLHFFKIQKNFTFLHWRWRWRFRWRSISFELVVDVLLRQRTCTRSALVLIISDSRRLWWWWRRRRWWCLSGYYECNISNLALICWCYYLLFFISRDVRVIRRALMFVVFSLICSPFCQRTINKK